MPRMEKRAPHKNTNTPADHLNGHRGRQMISGTKQSWARRPSLERLFHLKHGTDRANDLRAPNADALDVQTPMLVNSYKTVGLDGRGED
jgi:hypothetical protein